MDELRRLAKAHYRASSPELKKEAQELFNSLDSDGDGSVDKKEFISFMTEQGEHYMNNEKTFNALDTDGNHTLDFWEVMTLLYIWKSGSGRICDGCGVLIPAAYFICLQCPDYDLCISCYENDKSGHNHHQFMDNYTLLAVKRRSELKADTDGVTIISHHSASTYDDDDDDVNEESYTAVRAIVPAAKYRKRKLALEAFKIALRVANNCSIM